MESHAGKTTILGAPKCRCTESVVAMVFIMTGIILMGIGAVLAGFLSHELVPLIAGGILLFIGLLVTALGTVFLYMPNLIPQRMVGASSRRSSIYTSQASLETAPIPQRHEATGANRAAAPGTDPYRPPQQHAAGVVYGQSRQPVRTVEAPPAYDAAVRGGGRSGSGASRPTSGAPRHQHHAPPQDSTASTMV